MKIRNGFVSNSSSSSFLVAFPCNPKNINDVLDMVFNGITFFCHPYAGDLHYPSGYPTKQIAEVIWNNAKKQIPNNRKYILSNMHNVIVDRFDEFYIQEDGVSKWDLEFDHKSYYAENERTVEEFMLKYSDSFHYHFEYGDGDGPLKCAMEHGDLFKRLPHLVSSNH